MVAEGGVHQGSGQRPVHVAGLVHVAGGVQRVQAPVPLLTQLVPGVIELGPVVCRGLLDDEHVASHGVHGQPQHQAQCEVLKSQTSLKVVNVSLRLVNNSYTVSFAL